MEAFNHPNTQQPITKTLFCHAGQEFAGLSETELAALKA